MTRKRSVPLTAAQIHGWSPSGPLCPLHCPSCGARLTAETVSGDQVYCLTCAPAPITFEEVNEPIAYLIDGEWREI